MADDTGSIAAGSTPEWAKEITLQKILASIGDDFKKEVSDMSKSVLREFKQGHQLNKKIIENLREIAKASGGGDGKDTSEAIERANHNLGNLSKASDKTAEGMSDMSDSTDKARSNLTRLGAAAGAGALSGIGFLINQAKKAAETFIETGEAMRSIHEVGMMLPKGDFIQFRKDLASIGMTTEQASEMMNKYSTAIGRYGFNQVIDFAKSVKATKEGIEQFGLTTSEITEYTSNYLDIQRQMGMFRRQSDAEVQQGMTDYLSSLTAYSRIMNVSRKDMEAELEATAKRRDLQAVLMGMDEETRANVSAAAEENALFLRGTFGEVGSEMQADIVDMMSRADPTMSPAYKEAVKAGGVQYAEAMADVARAAKRGEKMTLEQAKALQEGAQAATKYASAIQSVDELRPGMEKMGAVAMVGADAMERLFNMMGDATNREELKEKILAEATDPMVGQLANATEAATRLIEGFDTARLEAFNKALGEDGATDALETFTSGANIAADWLANDFIELIPEMPFDSLGKNVMALVGLFGAAGALMQTIVTGITIWWGSKAVASLLGRTAGLAGLGRTAGTVAGGTVAGATAGTALGAGAMGAAASAAMLTAAAYTGWKIGGAIYNEVGDDEEFIDAADRVGRGVDSILGFFGNDAAQRRLAAHQEAEALNATPAEIREPGTPRINSAAPETRNTPEADEPTINTDTMTEVQIMAHIAEKLTEIERHSDQLVRLNRNGVGMPH